MNIYYINHSDFIALTEGKNFNNHAPAFESVNEKHYIKVSDWGYWVSSDPIKDYVLSTFNLTTIEEVVDLKFELLDQQEYEAHKKNLLQDPEAFIEKEWVLCDKVMKSMAAVLQSKIANGDISFSQGLRVQNLFAKQEPLLISSLGVTLDIPVTEYLAQLRSLGGAYVRLLETPIDPSIGFTQELKDEFLTLIQKGRDVLNA